MRSVSNFRSSASWFPAALSASIRRISTPGKVSLSSSSTRWVPTPTCFITPPQTGQRSTARSEWPQ